MTIVLETPKSVRFGFQAHIVRESDLELAWAENYVKSNPAHTYILGRYTAAEQANQNGQMFSLDDLRKAQATLEDSPLNMGHDPRAVVGHFIKAEIMYPTADTAASRVETPYMEALAVFYKYYFQNEFELISKAQSEGALFFSMEALPTSVTCMDPNCGEEFAYAGPAGPGAPYCAHMQEMGARRRLNEPHFTGGALIVPPLQPGWRQADITELSDLFEDHAKQTELAGEADRSDTSEYVEQLMQRAKDYADQRRLVDQDRWEYLMESLVAAVAESEEPEISKFGDYDLLYEISRDFTEEKRKKLAKKGEAMPHGGFPIENEKDLRNAIKAIGRAKNPAAAKAHIIRRARALKLTNLLPEGWK